LLGQQPKHLADKRRPIDEKKESRACPPFFSLFYFYSLLGFNTSRLAASPSFRRTPESSKPNWMPQA
jgi:hypothetical protein